VTERDKRILFDFVDACLLPRCPICTLVQRAEQRTLAVYCAEGAGDQQRRADVRAARGLCAPHGAQLRDAKDAMAAAVTAYDVLTNLQRDLVAVRSNPRTWGRRGIARPEPCPVCVDMQRYNRAVCAGIVAWSADLSLQQALANSHGICGPHLRTISRQAGVADEFWGAQSQAWQRLHDQLGEFIRKRDDRFRHERQAEEADAWKRAWHQISGDVLNDITKE
jgi:hypothetical protein